MLDILLELESFFVSNAIDHRFVGGVSYTGWINTQTKFSLSAPKKQVILSNTAPLSLHRSNGTHRDIDVILVSPTEKELQLAKSFASTLPCQISIEAVASPQKSLRLLPQLLTNIISDDSKIYLQFDQIQEEISAQTLEAWHLVLSKEATLTVRHPYAEYLAYHFRVPSGLKPKDVQKVNLLKPLALEAKASSPVSYKSWQTYLNRLSKATGKTKLKATFTRWYWRSLGNFLSQGNYPFSSLFTNNTSPFA